MKTVKYYAINLQREGEQRENMLRQARERGIEIEIIAAVTGQNLSECERADYDRKKRLKFFPRELTDDEIACIASHRKALQTFLESNADYGVILEDDTELHPHFITAI